MTEPTEPDGPLEPLDPAREEALLRALAEAGGPEPVPPAVAERLDGALADLVAERGVTVSHPENPGIVVPLDDAARRRRLRVRVLLGAAAAAVAVALGAGYLSDHRVGDVAADSASDEAPARSEDAAAGSSALKEESPPAVADAASPEADASELAAPGSLPLRRVVTDGPVRAVRPDHLREDLVALQHVSLPRPASADYARATLSAPSSFLCQPADFGAGYLVGVQYDDRPAVVAFREPAGSTQAAEVLACGTGDVLHSLTLAAAG